MNGEVTLISTGSSLTLTDPAGASVSLAGTMTTGLQEFVNLVASSGFPGKAVGPGLNASGSCPAPFVIGAGHQLRTPPMFGASIEIQGFIDATAGSDPAVSPIFFDTMSRCRFHHYGLINLAGTCYHAIRFEPTNLRHDNAYIPWQGLEIYGCDIRLGNINLMSGSFNSAVLLNAGNAAFNNNPRIEFGEIICRGNSAYGILIPTPAIGTPGCFAQNIVRTGLIDSATVGEFSEGNSSLPSGCPLGTNIYELAGITTGRANTLFGVSISGVMNIVLVPSISVNSGGFTNGIIFQSGSLKNYVICTQNQGTNPVSDSGTGNVVVT